MKSIEEILSFNFNPLEFSGRIARFDVSKFEASLERHVSNLNVINEKLGEASYKFDDESLVQRVYTKFNFWARQDLNNLHQPNFDKRESKALAYAIDYSDKSGSPIVSSDTLVSKALFIFERNWRNNYLLGIFLCCLRNWGRQDYVGIEQLRHYIAEKLNDYSGTRHTLLSLKKNLRYFASRNGDIILGSDFAINKSKPSSVCDYLGIPASWVTYAYFNNFIQAFFEKRKSELSVVYPEIEEFLLLHQNSETILKVISKIIIQADSSSFSSIQDRIQKFALKNIGDPVKTNSWNHTGLMQASEASEVQQARTILNKWITKRFINVFFDTCLNDPRRKAFWLRYSDRIETFRVFGPYSVKRTLERDQRISEFVPSRFQATYSNTGISAIVMVLNDYKLIEFSDPGYAFYAYRKSNPYSPELENTRYSSVSSFRNGNMPYLVHRSGYQFNDFSPEGRLSHNDGDLSWEQVFKIWIERYV